MLYIDLHARAIRVRHIQYIGMSSGHLVTRARAHFNLKNNRKGAIEDISNSVHLALKVKLIGTRLLLF